MKTKMKVVKTAKICGIVAKVLYLLSFVLCLAFIALAIALPLTDAISSISPAEVAVIFGTLALYAFILIGLLWNIEGIFNTIAKEQTAFAEKVVHYLKKVAVFVIILSVTPAILGSAVLRIVCPTTEITFPIELCGIIVGAVLFIIGTFFSYGKELQEREDETL